MGDDVSSTFNPAGLDSREARGFAIISKGEPIQQEGKNKWYVPSQRDPTKTYLVTRYAHATKGAQTRWTCQCPDYQNRGVECKHIHAVKFLEAARKSLQTTLPGEKPKKPRATRPAPTFASVAPDAEPAPLACKWCTSTDIKRNGFKNGKQEYRCLAETCGRAFIPNAGFARLKGEPKVICLALDLHFKGVSLRALTDTLENFFGLKVDHSTVYRWIQRYVRLITEYAATLEPWVGDKWHADEVFTKFSGKLEYLWHVMDADTRYLLVSRVTAQRNDRDALAVMREARTLAGKVPDEVVTDGLYAYQHAVRSQLRGAKHTREIHVSKPDRYPQNNRVERLNGTVRQRQKVTRGLKKPEGPLTQGQPVFYNHVRPHQALGGRTPAEAAGVGVRRRPEESRWAALIRDALRAE